MIYNHNAEPTPKKPIALALAVILFTMLLGNNIFTKISLLLWLIFFTVKTAHVFKDVLKVSLRAPWLFLFELWAASSILWSVVPSVTLDIIAVQAALLCLCILVARYATEKDVIKGLKLSAVSVIILVTIFAISFPVGVFAKNGFSAFYDQKNKLGLVMAVCLIIIVYSPKLNWKDYFLILIAAIFLILSKSKTSISVIGLVFATTFVHFGLRRFLGNLSTFARDVLYFSSKIVLAFTYLFIILVVVLRDTVATYLINNIPYNFLTGRGELWIAVLRRAEIDLLRGLGPGSFWGAGRLSEIAQTSLFTKYPFWTDRLGSADGGYIDLIGGLGFVGLALMFLSLISNYRRLITIAGDPVSGLAMALITFFAIHNITETTVYHAINPLWFMYIFLTYYLIFRADRISGAAR